MDREFLMPQHSSYIARLKHKINVFPLKRNVQRGRAVEGEGDNKEVEGAVGEQGALYNSYTGTLCPNLSTDVQRSSRFIRGPCTRNPFLNVAHQKEAGCWSGRADMIHVP